MKKMYMIVAFNNNGFIDDTIYYVEGFKDACQLRDSWTEGGYAVTMESINIGDFNDLCDSIGIEGIIHSYPRLFEYALKKGWAKK